MGAFGIDVAWDHPHPAALSAAGVRFVGRYFSHDGSKNLTRPEYQDYRAHGIQVIVAWETTAERSLQGKLAGREDGFAALDQARKCGMPRTQALFLAVDFDATGPQVYEYFRGAREICGRQTGVYGGYRPTRYLFDNNLVSYGWQTYAWSNGMWDARAGVRQYSNDRTLAGVSCDFDVAIHQDYGQGVAGSSELDVLLPAERVAVRKFDGLRVHPARHPVAYWKIRNEINVMRQDIWTAAVRGRVKGGRVPGGWAVRNRIARYRALESRVPPK